MTDTFKHIAALLGMALLLMLVSGVLGGLIGYRSGVRHCQSLPDADAVIIVDIDSTTIQGTAARPDADSLIRVDSVPYPVPYPVPVYVDGETVIIHDTIESYLAREYRLFSVPDTCDIWYSGVDTRIDSINMYYHHTTEIIKQPYEVAKMPVLSLNVGAGAMYQEGQVIPCLFWEIPFNSPKFPNTEFKVFGAIDHEGRWGAGVGISHRFNLIK